MQIYINLNVVKVYFKLLSVPSPFTVYITYFIPKIVIMLKQHKFYQKKPVQFKDADLQLLLAWRKQKVNLLQTNHTMSDFIINVAD